MKKSYIFLISLIILIASLLALASFFRFKELIDLIDQRSSLRSQEKGHITLLASLKAAEASQRAYIITGQQDYLELYNQAKKAIDENLQQLEIASPLSNEQRAFIQELGSLIQLKVNDLDDLIYMRQSDGFEAVKKSMSSEEGKLLMDRIRVVLRQLMSSQSEVLNKNQQAIQTFANQSLELSLLNGFMFAISIALLAYLLGRNHLALKEEQEKSRDLYELYRAILDDQRHIIMTLNTKGIVTNFNKGAEKFLGYDAAEVVHKLSVVNFYDQDNLREKSKRLVHKSKQSNLLETLIASNRFFLESGTEWMMKKKNGNLFPCYQSIIALRNASNSVQGYLLIASDLSGSKRGGQLWPSVETIPLSDMSRKMSSQELFSWKVLVVDNDPDFLAILTTYLNDLGCQVIPAITGEEALNVAKLSDNLDLITMDMLMAPLNGYDVAQKLQNDPALKNIPIAFISVIAKEIQGKIPGVIDYIEKPIKKEDVVKLLQKCQMVRNTDKV